MTVDLVDQTLTLPDGSTVTFPIDEFAKYCMLNGVDELGYISCSKSRPSPPTKHSVR